MVQLLLNAGANGDRISGQPSILQVAIECRTVGKLPLGGVRANGAGGEDDGDGTRRERLNEITGEGRRNSAIESDEEVEGVLTVGYGIVVRGRGGYNM